MIAVQRSRQIGLSAAMEDMRRARDVPEFSFRVRRQVLVTLEMVVSAPDTGSAAAISDLVMGDLGVRADCARVIQVMPHGAPVVEAGDSDFALSIGSERS